MVIPCMDGMRSTSKDVQYKVKQGTPSVREKMCSMSQAHLQ